ncbi:hypothetical protein BDW02DRAFT_186631 [Decorospora gaudefroyi]|uniref:Uncharacterized protein n=1 Tax=Decorospora gaudefroyi TaxID=184978 RepID=A0A6A5KMG8_9PLEO|nr:hypothetical protein BDW02DRAFT_186631 [Decorospora gaudefroyi]
MAYPKIPASIILPPRELKQYKRWQCLHTNTKPAEQGFVPTAREYEDFQQWLKRQDSGYFSDIFDDISGHLSSSPLDATTSTFDSPVASICQHTMHPIAAGQLRSRCPCCVIDMHVKYMHVLSHALRSAGGHAPSCTLTSSDHQDTVYSAWCRGKLCTLTELSKLESMADEEAAWSAQYPDVQYEDAKTATQALEQYWTETMGFQRKQSRPKKQRAVVFAQGTDFTPGRPNPYFHRRSPRYEPGKYTVVDQEAEEEDEDEEDLSHAPTYHFGMAEESISPSPDTEGESPQEDDSVEELEDDDGDWEDVESDEEDSDSGDEPDEGDCVYFKYEEETSFIVFGDD